MPIEPEKTKKKTKTAKISAPKKSPAAKTDSALEYIVIDHPKSREKIHPHHYAIRIGAHGGTSIEISIDDGDWKHCRHAGGYFWYDWHPVSGKHIITARMKLSSGKLKKSKITHCEVA